MRSTVAVALDVLAEAQRSFGRDSCLPAISRRGKVSQPQC